MVEKLETHWRRRFDAAIEAIELLHRAGFNIHEFNVNEEATDETFELTVEMSVGELTRPLEVLD